MKRSLLNLLFSPDPAEGTPPSDPQNPPTETTAPPVSPPATLPTPVAPPNPPPAAKIVAEGTKTERELALERDLKQREQRLAELEDQNRQLRDLPKPPKPPPASAKKSFLVGGTFFED